MLIAYFQIGFYYGVIALGFISVFFLIHYVFKLLVSIKKHFDKIEELKNARP